LILYNAPAVFWGLWSVVKGFVDPVTRKKIVFVGKAERQAVFGELFEPQVGTSRSAVLFMNCH
jgi:hypothetical protein